VPPRYKDPGAFLAAANTRLKTAAGATGRPVNEIRREFVFQRFLARVFNDPDSCWLLKGGAGLLIRLPVARYSRDVDLLYPEASLDEAVEQLRLAAALDLGDHLHFSLGEHKPMTGEVIGANVGVDVYVGAILWDRFTVDLSTALTFTGRPDQQQPAPVVDIPDVAPMPAISLYPLPDQIADKVCAMYDAYSGQPSSRYRDLVDLVLILTSSQVDAAEVTTALHSEAARRRVTLPERLHSPSQSWTRGYTAAARGRLLPAGARTVHEAIHLVGRCLHPLLSGTVTVGSWDPTLGTWRAERV